MNGRQKRETWIYAEQAFILGEIFNNTREFWYIPREFEHTKCASKVYRLNRIFFPMLSLLTVCRAMKSYFLSLWRVTLGIVGKCSKSSLYQSCSVRDHLGGEKKFKKDIFPKHFNKKSLLSYKNVNNVGNIQGILCFLLLIFGHLYWLWSDINLYRYHLPIHQLSAVKLH